MLINKKKFKLSVTEILAAVISALYLLGIHLWFPVCEVMGEKPMSCHWAGEVLGVAAILLTVLSLAHIIIPDEKIKTGMGVSFACISLFLLFIPGNIISLCADPSMSCKKGTALWTTVFMLALLFVTIADIIVYLNQVNKNKHKREKTEK